MTTKGNNGVPVQDTSRKATNSEMDSFGYYETPLSTQESPNQTYPISIGRKHEISEENNSTSADSYRPENAVMNMTHGTNIDATLGGNCTSEDHGPHHQPCIYNGQGHLDFSCTSPNTNASEASEDKRETFEGTGSKYNASTQASNVQEFMRLDDKTTMSCVSENNTPIVPVSEDKSTVDFDKNNFAPEIPKLCNSTTELYESRQNSDVTCEHKDGILSHHETSNTFSPSSETSQNMPNFDDGAYTTTTHGDNTDKNTSTDPKNKITDHGRDNNYPSCHRSNIKKNHAKEDKAKAFDSTSFNDNTFVGLQQDIDATEDIRLDEPEENSTIAGLEECDFVSEFHRSNNHVTELSVSSHNIEECCEPSDLTSAHDEDSTSSLAANGNGQNASNIKTDHVTMEESNAMDSEDQTPTNHGGGNNDSSCCKPNLKETDVKEEEKRKTFDNISSNDNSSIGLQKDKDQPEVNRPDDHNTMIWKSENSTTAGLEENNLVQEVHRSNSITEPPESRHNNDDIPARHEVNKSYSAAIQIGQDASNLKTADGTIIDDYSTTAYSKLPMGRNTLENSRNEVFTKGDPSSDCFTSYRNPFIGPKDKTSSRQDNGRDDIDWLSCRPNLIETDAKYEKCKAFDGILKNNVSMGLQQDSDVKKATSAFKTNNSANKDASKEHHAEDDISSAHGGDNKRLSCHRPNSQPQTPTIEGSPKALKATSCQQDENNSDVSQLDGHVSLPSRSLEPKMDKRNGSGRSSKVYKICNWSKDLRNSVFQIIMILCIVVPVIAQAFPSEPQWQKFVFHNKSLANQTLVITNREHSQNCSFTFTTTPSLFSNCKRIFILAINETYIEFFTTYPYETWNMEYGHQWIGGLLPATRGETLNDTSMRAIIAKFNNSTDNPMEMPPKENGNNNKDKNNNTVMVIAVIAVLLFGLFGLLYKFCKTFKRWVNEVLSSCRKCFTNNDNGSNSNPNPNHEDSNIPLAENANGHLRNEENQPKNQERLLNGSQLPV